MSGRRMYFLGGLPRSGSTLLCNILAQNPRIHTTHTSGCADMLFGIRNAWDQLIEHKAHPDSQAQRRVLRAVLQSYHGDVGTPVILDKSRGWVSVIEMVRPLLDHPPRVIVPVRDVRDVLASFELIWRQQSALGQIPGERENYFQFQAVEGRLAFWMRPDQPVGLALNRIRDVVVRGHGSLLHFVPFERLTSNPRGTLADIYAFLEEEPYPHDFESVDQVTEENDAIHGFTGLHRIRPKVEPIASRWPVVLGEAAEQYARMNFWAPIVREQTSALARRRFADRGSEESEPISREISELNVS